MMKTVAFLLLLSSTNAARVDNDIPLEQTSEDEYSKQQTMDARAPMIVDKDNDMIVNKDIEIVIDDEMTEEVQAFSRQASTSSNNSLSQLIVDDENQHGQQEDPSLLINPEDQREGAQRHEVTEEEKKTLLGKFGQRLSGMVRSTSTMAKNVAISIKDNTVKAGQKIGATAGNVKKATIEKAGQAKKTTIEKAGQAKAKVIGNYQTVSERSGALVTLVKEPKARAIVAAVVLAISWVVVPWFIVRQIVEFITSKPKAGVISALITMFVAIPAALVAVLLHENTFNKVVKFLGQPFFGTQENTQIVEEVMVNENDVPNTN